MVDTISYQNIMNILLNTLNASKPNIMSSEYYFGWNEAVYAIMKNVKEFVK